MDILFQPGKSVCIQVMVHIASISQADVTASNGQAVIDSQSEVMHQVAGIFNSLAVLPTNFIQLSLAERLSCHHVGERGYLLAFELRDQVGISIGSKDNFVRTDFTMRCVNYKISITMDFNNGCLFIYLGSILDG